MLKKKRKISPYQNRQQWLIYLVPMLQILLLMFIIATFLTEQDFRGSDGYTLTNERIISLFCIRTIAILLFIVLIITQTIRLLRHPNKLTLQYTFSILWLSTTVGIFTLIFMRSEDIYLYQDRQFIQSFQADFDEIIALGQSTDCYSSEVDCSDAIKLPSSFKDWLGNDRIVVTVIDEVAYIIIPNRPSYYPLVYTEAQAPVSDLTILGESRHCSKLYDYWYLCK